MTSLRNRALGLLVSLFAPFLCAELQAASVYVSEIMYHPPSTNLLEQWFELYNGGTKSVSLAGWRVTKGVDFTFPANATIPRGGYLVVAADAATFQARHPDVLNFVAGWQGKLGHVIEISDASGKAVNSVEFHTEGDWATRVLGEPMYNHRGWEWQNPADGGGASLELINPALPNSYAHNWAPNQNNSSTPGQQNSVATIDAAPFISGVSHWPAIPQPADSVYVTARIVDENVAATSVFIDWRVDGESAFFESPMSDDGAHQDGIAGDGVFGAIIPPHANHTIVEFYIVAIDSAGHSRKYPNFVPPQNSSRTANLLFQVDAGSYAGTQPVYRIIMTEAERAELYALGRGCPDSDSDAEMNGTWITRDGILSGGTTTQVRYNVGVRNRGHGTRQSNPNNYHVNIPDDRLWKNQAGLNLNSQYTHAQVIGSAVMRKAGLAMADSRPVQVRVNSTNLMSLSLPDNNSFGSYGANEQYNADFIKRTFPLDPEGNSYRGIRDQVLCVPSLGGVADLSWHGTNWAVAGYTNAYFKQNNFVENDWSDLIKLIGVLNVTDGTTAATYAGDVEKVINVEEWMRYMAANTLLDNNETCLANGVGDDYALYRGKNDPRFLALPYDLDTVMGRGTASTSPRDGIFRMTALPVMDRFMKTPQFAPIYFGMLKQLGETVFSSEQMDPLLDQLLGGLVPADKLSNMKAFNASHVSYVLSQIPISLTATITLAQVNGYYHTTAPAVSISGTGNAIDTRKILVNGAPADWVAWKGEWSLANLALHPGINRLDVRALGTNDTEIGRTNIDIWFDDGTVQSEGGTISANTHWTAAAGPYAVNSTLTVASGATLTIDPGTTIYLASGADINVASGGRLLAEGTESAPIRFTRAPGGSGTWGGIVVNGAAGSPETRIIHSHIEFNGSTAIHSSSGTVYLDYLTFGTTDKQYVSLDASSFVVSHCHFPTPTAAFEPAHGNGGIKPGGHGVFLRNFFGPPNGYNDVVDFTGGQRGGPIVYFIDNVFMGGGDDGLDLDGTDAWVEGNIFMHIHQNGAPDSSSAISGGKNGVDTSEVTIIGNLIFDCDDAATAKEGNFYTLLNNTIVHTTKTGGTDSAAGVINVQDVGTAFGKGYYLEGNIIADAEQLVRNHDPAQGVVTFENNILPSAWDGPGGNNFVGDPMLKHIPTIAEAQFNTWEQAQIMREWFSLRPGSPGSKSGPGGKDQGGVVPPGAYVWGQPKATNNQNSATINVGVNRKGSGSPASGWPAGSGYTAYKWRLDAGQWSTETPIDTPITLSGLSNGPHSVDVAGKNDAGLYQDDPIFGEDAGVTSTGAWYVDTAAPAAVPVVINEILASNATVLTNGGSTPDLVELHNTGTAAADLSGMHLTSSFGNPYAFTFPEGTSLAAGAYLVLFADNATATGQFHLGFNLNSDGDDLYLLDKSLAVLDSVRFGVQVTDLSIGRNADGTWTLCKPTFGAANIAAPLGDASALRINEWLTDSEFAAAFDFVEIYNPDDRPVGLGGFFLSDAAPTPNLFEIRPLSFLSAKGLVSYIADGNPKQGPRHLNFKLSAEVGLIRLSDRAMTTVDLVEYGPQATDVSEGRSPDGATVIGFFEQPTPGAPNPGASTSGTITNIVRTTQHLVNFADSWRYDDSGTDLGTAWRGVGFGDASWPSGKALFYHGNNPSRMPVPIGTTLPPFKSPEQSTFYFRTHFNFSGSTSDLTLNLTDVIDDGVVVHLNGFELFRNNMPGGTVSYSTLASSTVTDATQAGPANLSATHIVEGDNVLAVEVHQSNLTSSDIAMAIALDAVHSQTNIIENGSQSPAVVLNEIFAARVPSSNSSTFTDWLELYNPSTNTFDLANLSLTDDLGAPAKWVFPANTSIATHSFLLISCDADSPSSATNTAFSLNSDGGTLYLFDASSRGGALLDSVRYGIQVRGYSLGRTPDGTGDWTLNLPTQSAANQAVQLGSAKKLRLNEWMASSSTGSDWFEIYNGDSAPVALGGLFLSDDLTDRAKFHIQPLSFIGTDIEAFAKFDADGAPANGARHVNFNLSAKGEEIGLYDSDGTPIDTAVFGAQTTDVSQGHLPDGSGPITSFPLSASPGESNYLPIADVVINEVLPNAAPPLEQAIELHNTSQAGVDISGWFLSNSSHDYEMFRVPAGTKIPANGYIVFYENQFNPTPAGLKNLLLDGMHGDSVILSAANTDGTLTGARSVLKFGPSERGVSFGPYTTAVGTDVVPLASHTFGQDNPTSVEQFRNGQGAANAQPKIGPIVISEIMFYPPLLGGTNDNTRDEFIELHNTSGSPVALYDPNYPTNTWHLRGGVAFEFPQMTIPPNGYLALVSFDPNGDSLLPNQFAQVYGSGLLLVGPYRGKLSNSGESVELYKPTPPVTTPGPDYGIVPYVLVEKVDYSSAFPWPIGADGTGRSLHRVDVNAYANDPLNWAAGTPNPGSDIAQSLDSDGDGMPDDWESARNLNPHDPSDAALDPDGDGLSNLAEYLAGTDPQNASSTFQGNIDSLAGKLQIRFSTLAGRIYSIEGRSALLEGDWEVLTQIGPVQQDGTAVWDIPTATGNVAFFRVSVRK